MEVRAFLFWKGAKMDYRGYLEFAKSLADEAGDIMRKYFNQSDISHYKGDNTIVTVADEEINKMVIERVREAYPEHGVFGEEGSEGVEREYLWLCDPIDGTGMFARGVPVAVFSLALVVDGDPVMGVVYDPFCDKLYSAAKGQGAFCNGRPIHVNDVKLGDKREIINTDVWWVDGLIDDPLPIVNRLYEVSNWPASIGSVARAATLVADGGFAAAVFAWGDGKSMDVAAAKVIVEEAKGKATDIFGNDQRYDKDIRGVILSNGVVHDEIVRIFKEEVGKGGVR